MLGDDDGDEGGGPVADQREKVEEGVVEAVCAYDAEWYHTRYIPSTISVSYPNGRRRERRTWQQRQSRTQTSARPII